MAAFHRGVEAIMDRVKEATRAALSRTAEITLFLAPALALLAASWQFIGRYQDAIVKFIVTF